MSRTFSIGEMEVKDYLTVCYADVLRMEISFILGILIHAHSRLWFSLHYQSFAEDNGTARLHEGTVMAEGFEISLFRPVDVKVVRVSGCDDGHPRTEPMERAVKLISFYHNEL